MTRAVPVFSPIIFVQKIANAIAAEPHADGVCRDTILRIRGAAELEKRPDLIDHARIMSWSVKLWHAANNKILNKASEGFVLVHFFVKVEKYERADEAAGYTHLRADWDVMDEKSSSDLITRWGKNSNTARNGGATLCCIQNCPCSATCPWRVLYGYVETLYDETPFAAAAEEDFEGLVDDEDEPTP